MSEAKTNRLVQKIRKQREKICEMRIGEAEDEQIHAELMALKKLMDNSRTKLGLGSVEHISMAQAESGGVWLFSATKPERDENGEFQIVDAPEKIEKNSQEISKLMRKANNKRTDTITSNALKGVYL